MEGLTVKELAEYTAGEIVNLQEDIGILLKLVVKDSGRSVTVVGYKEINHRLFKWTSLLDSKSADVLMVNLDFLMEKGTNGTGDNIDEMFPNKLKKVLNILVNYWLSYREVKKAEGIVFRTLRQEELVCNVMREIFVEKEFKDHIGDLKILGWGERANELSGYIQEETVERFRNVKEIHNKLVEISKVDPLFCIGVDHFKKKTTAYLMESYKINYCNENFFLIPDGDKLLFQGDTMGTRILDLNAESVDAIIEIIKEEKKLVNLFHPSIFNLKWILKGFLKLSVSDDILEGTVLKMDEKLGENNTERQLFYVAEELKKFYRLTKLDKKTDELKVKEIKSNVYNLYSVNVQEVYWFILVSDSDEFVIDYSETYQIPKSIEKKTIELQSKYLIKNK